MIQQPNTAVNNPKKAGKNASKVIFLDSEKRYAVRAVHTRFEAIQWFVTDSSVLDDLGLATVIRQENTFADAIKDFIK